VFFFLGREVPRESLEFVIKSFGGDCIWDSPTVNVNDPRITHQIVDRPKLLGDPIISREYVQPQYVYDCVNTKALIPTTEYGVGMKLPPHLSPFVEDSQKGYIPEYRYKLEEYFKEQHGVSSGTLLVRDIVEQSSDSSDDEHDYVEQLKAEKEGNYSVKTGKKKEKEKKRKYDNCTI